MSTAALWVCTNNKKTMMKAKKSAFVKSSETRIMTRLIRWCLYTRERERPRNWMAKKVKWRRFWTFEKLYGFILLTDQIVVCIRQPWKDESLLLRL